MEGLANGRRISWLPALSVTFTVNKMGWVNTNDRFPAVGQVAQCRLKHCTTGEIQEERLVRVAEDDCEWRTAEGRQEVSYEWDVIDWEDSLGS